MSSSSSSTNTINHNTINNKMEQSITAALFVPAHQRYMNDLPSTIVFTPSHSLPTSHEACAQRRLELCPTVAVTNIPAANNATTGVATAATASTATKLPFVQEAVCPVRSLQVDTHFAIHHRQQLLRQQEQKSTSSLQQQQQQQQLPRVDNISNLSAYCETFERLLREEREEVLLLYERYSQYNHVIHTTSITPTTTAKAAAAAAAAAGTTTPYNSKTRFKNNKQQHQQLNMITTTTPLLDGSSNVSNGIGMMDAPSFRVKTNIKGIADATPPIQVGDLFLVRPTCPIRLPHPQNPSFLLPQGHVIEIQTQISHLKRHHPAVLVNNTGSAGEKKKKNPNKRATGTDQILATWLNTQQHYFIMHHYQAELAYADAANNSHHRNHHRNGNTTTASPNNNPNEFHIRIVPNPSHLVRCLTALTWLAATCPPQMAMELLFPTSAPQVPDGDDYDDGDDDMDDDMDDEDYFDKDDNDKDDVVEEKKAETKTISSSSTSLSSSNPVHATAGAAGAGSSNNSRNTTPTTSNSHHNINNSNTAGNNNSSTSKLQKAMDNLSVANQDVKKMLNDKQASFVRMVLRRTRHADYHQVRAPLVLTGPAGTGKTKTLLCAIQKVLALNKTTNTSTATSATTATNKRNTTNTRSNTQVMRILVCTPSHTAADVVTKRLGQFLNRQQLFRLLDSDRPIATIPTAVLGFCRQDDDSGIFVLPSVEELLQFQVIVCTCHDAHLLYLTGLTNHQLRLHRQELQRQTIKSFRSCGIVVDENPAIHEPHWTHLFIDEAAQATEPESLIPLSVVVDPSSWFNNSTSRKVEIALVGDPRQLQPRVYCTAAAQAGLERSWMERLLRRPVGCLGGGYAHMLGPEMIQMDELLRYSFQREGQEQLSSFLTLNYRGHPSFLAMPSALFYSDKLQSADYYQFKQLRAQGGVEGDFDATGGAIKGEAYWCAKLREIEGLELPVIASMAKPGLSDEVEQADMALLWPKKQYTFPIHFRGVLGSDMSVTIESGFTGESWTNPAEADVVSEIVKKLVDCGVSSQSIGVMSPFRGQVVLIRKLLRAQGLDTVNVGTIEDYQGVERDTIVLSLTRSTKSFVSNDGDARMGVFGQPKRSNVAMTRAENLLIVVGNPNVMAEDHVWRQWLWFCLRNGLWYGARGETEALCQCEPSLLKLVRYYPYTNAPSPPPPLAQSNQVSSPTANDGNVSASPALATQQQIVAISSLERLLRT